MELVKLWQAWPTDALKPALALHPYAQVQVLWQPSRTVWFFGNIRFGKATTYLLLEGENGDSASLASYDRDFDVVWIGIDRDGWDLSDALRRAKAHPLVRAHAERRRDGEIVS